MTLSEFVEQVTEEMEKDSLHELPVVFNTAGRSSLEWLSIYVEGGVVHMDIGGEDE